ncbi:MAG: ATP-grasp domain-containing protein [Bacteroidales bacterium]|nr:ATP-grasp domain-containing protein [Bacteroidales bacterium]
MIILDKPYISEFLLKTLEFNQIPVIHNSVVDELTSNRNLNLLSEEQAVTIYNSTDNPLLYTNSENSISWIENNLSHTSLPGKIKLFKNKILFRDLISDLFPSYFYRGVKLDDMEILDITTFPLPFIIKPAIGFFSLGVYKVESAADWKKTVSSIKNEIDLVKNLYPPEVLHMGEFIIEECIEGDEFAIDCYFNKDGKPVVMNIMKHIFSSGADVNDRVYITSKEIIESFKNPFAAFLSEIGKRAELRNFPAHVEVRITENGMVAPIEVNPLRFGGWCSTPDLAWYAFGINLYEYLFQQKEPDWNLILQDMDGAVFSNIVLNNSTGIEGKNVLSFDYERLLSDFEKPLELRKTDYKKFPLFGFLFCETRKQNMEELNRILLSDLNEYVK